ncbi:MAG: Ornithine cyclodeaminase [Frankiales bacterium]|nr:Ornithine cyclodeaminase [Frankiales bacterium]
MLLLDDKAVAAELTPAAALSCVETAFRLFAEGAAINEPRHRTATDGATLNVMWALAPTLDAVAMKCYPVVRSDVSQASIILITLFSHSTGEPLALLQGDLLGQRRTAAASALATRLAARPDSRTLTVFGTGYQAWGQVQALAGVLPGLEKINVVGRTPSRLHRFITALSAAFPGLTFVACDAEEGVRDADVVVTATGATTPLFPGEWLRPGTHVNAIGSNQPHSRELDRTTLTRAATVIVDSRAVVSREGGDLLANDFPADMAVELGDLLVSGEVARRDDADITVFDSHGLAVQDLVCALHVLRATESARNGIRVSWPEQSVGTDLAAASRTVAPSA